MTSFIGLLPLLFGEGQTGKEILYPLALVVFGGMLTSTILDQLVTPALFIKFGRKVYERSLSGGRLSVSDSEKDEDKPAPLSNTAQFGHNSKNATQTTSMGANEAEVSALPSDHAVLQAPTRPTTESVHCDSQDRAVDE